MSGIQNFDAFLLACIVLNLIPGSDTFYILGRSLAQGRGVGFASALGISAGTLIHAFASAIGLSALIVASATAFFIVKMVGAAYLIYLGFSLLIRKPDTGLAHSSSSESGFYQAFRQGMVTNVLNPKVAMFFLAFLPQFVSADNAAPALSFLILGITFVSTSTLWTLTLAWGAAAIGKSLRENPKHLSYLNKGAGVLLMGLGIKLATDR